MTDRTPGTERWRQRVAKERAEVVEVVALEAFLRHQPLPGGSEEERAALKRLEWWHLRLRAHQMSKRRPGGR